MVLLNHKELADSVTDANGIRSCLRSPGLLFMPHPIKKMAQEIFPESDM